MGVLIFGLIQTLITNKGTLSSWWTSIAIGTLVLVFILLQNIVVAVSRKSARQA
jgi:simple sugar transport system permease protein